jgi:hypothetical protein
MPCGPEGGILHSHHCEKLKSYIIQFLISFTLRIIQESIMKTMAQGALLFTITTYGN